MASPEAADSFLKASHVTRTRRAHQITACSLYILLQRVYSEQGQNGISLVDWWADNAASSSHVQFWSIILLLELLVMIYLRSIREADFQLYVHALTKIAPWFFALDHTNYARWIPIHLRDMVSLQKTPPEVHSEFLKGNFVVNKLTHEFSAIAIDQAYEQNNACVKGNGGAVGLTENITALRCWMVSGPEMARVMEQFEITTEKRKSNDVRHHEQTKHAQTLFARNVKAPTAS